MAYLLLLYGVTTCTHCTAVILSPVPIACRYQVSYWANLGLIFVYRSPLKIALHLQEISSSLSRISLPQCDSNENTELFFHHLVTCTCLICLSFCSKLHNKPMTAIFQFMFLHAHAFERMERFCLRSSR